MRENGHNKKLGDIGKISSGKSIPSSEIHERYEKGLFPCFGGNGLRGYVKEYLYDGICPIIGRVGALCGNVHLAHGKFYPTEHALVMSIKSNDSPRYIEYLLKYLNLNQYAKGVAQPVLSASSLSEINVIVPPIQEQERIVAELDLLQDVIDKQKVQLKELDNLAQSIFHDTFGDPVKNDKGWQTRLLQDICSRVTDGSHFSPKEDINGRYPMLSVKDMSSSGFIYDSCKYINETDYKTLVSNGCKPSINDVLVAKDGSYLKTAFVQEKEVEQVVLSSIAIVSPLLSEVCPQFLAFFFKTPDVKLLVEKHYLTGTAIKRIILKGFRSMTIILPPLFLQQSFADKIDAIEEQKAAISASIAETQKLFDYTMDKYFG